MVVKTKRSMTSFDLASLVSEAKSVEGSRVSNIYSMPGGGFLFRLKGRGVDSRLVAVPGERVHFTRFDVSEKGFPPPLVMGLRKYLKGARLVSVSQLGFDRILYMDYEGSGGRWRVYVEVLPRGVLALVDREGRVLQASEFREMRDRVVKRGVAYSPPPGGAKPPVELEAREVARLLEGEGEAVRVLSRGLGYPGEAVEEALIRLGVEPSTQVSMLRGLEEELVEQFRSLYREALAAHGWIVYGENGVPVTVVTFEPKGLREHYGFATRFFEKASEAFDTYFVEELRRLEEHRLSAQVEAEKQRLLKSLEQARRNLDRLRERLARLDKTMTLVGENIGYVYEALECVRRVRERSGWDYIVGNCPGVIDVKPDEGVIVLNINGVNVELSVRVPPERLLVELSRKRGEIEAKIRRGEEALRELEEKLRSLNEQAMMLARRGRALVRRREWYEKYHWLFTSHGYLAIGGRDASQNESVVKKYLNDKRIFMHADIHGAPIVIVFAEGKEPPQQDLREAAVLTAAYSKAWKSGMGSVDVYWVWGSQVSKSAPAGEYLVKGSFMVYGKRNYIRNVELRLAIGVGLDEEGSPVVIAGPPELVSRRSLAYAVLVPGDEDPSRLAKRLRRLLASKAGEENRPLLEAVKPEELRLRIPGRARVIHVGRGEAKEPARPAGRLHGEEEGEASTGNE